MNDQRTIARTDSTAEAVAAALGRLGEATAATIAAEAGVAYSTTNKKLRALRDAGRAEASDSTDGPALWRLTAAAGRTAADAATTPTDPDTAARADLAAAASTAHDPEPAGDSTGPESGEPAATEVPAPPDVPAGTEATPLAEAGHTDDDPDEAVQADPDDSPDGGTEPDSEPARPADADTAADAGPVEAPPAPDPERPVDQAPAEPDSAPRGRRSAGTMPAAVLDVLEAHPDRQYKVGELCKAIDAANDGTDAAKASPGAVANAATKLLGQHRVIQTVEKPATYQLAPTGD